MSDETTFSEVQFDETKTADPEEGKAETKSDEETTYESLAQQPISELRLLHQKEFGVATKSKDRKRLAKKLAAHLVKKANGPATGLGLTKDEAEKIIVTSRDALIESEDLAKVKRTKMAEFRKKINEATEKIKTILDNSSDDPVVRLDQIDALWTRIDRLDAKQAKVADEFSQKISDAKKLFRDTLTTIRHPTLPNVAMDPAGDDADQTA